MNVSRQSHHTNGWKDVFVVPSDTKLPVIAEVDVAVAGGGAAGVAAAETVARHGRSVLVVEKYGFVGGAAVAGLSGTICGLFNSSERANDREIIVGGFAERFVRELLGRGGGTDPQRYGKTWVITHEPYCWKQAAEALLLGAGVHLLYHTMIVGVVKDGDAIKGLVVFSKSGLGVIRARAVIDASGDGQVVFSAGLGYTVGREGRVQNATMIYRLAGVDVTRFLAYWGDDTISPQKVVDLLVKEHAKDPGSYPRTKVWVFDTPRPNELLVNATRLVDEHEREYDPLDPFQATQAEIVAKHQVNRFTEFMRAAVPGCENAFVNDTATEIGVRQSRSIVGMERLTNVDVATRRKRPDGVVRSSWPIELHAGRTPTTEWLVDDFYEVPYGALVPVRGENIITAGRCISAEHEALASARVTAQCFGYGHAAGLATVEALRSGRSYREIDGAEIRRLLNLDGARMD